MLLGHFAVAIGAKRLTPRTSLGTLVAAAMFADLIWPLFLIAGIEKVRIDRSATVFTPLDFVYYPFSHSLEMMVLWGVLFAAVYYVAKRNARGAAVLGALVVSHWLLDFPMHRPDLPVLLFGDMKLGLGLWNNVAMTIGIEVGLLVIGSYFYLSMTRAKDRIGSIGFALSILLLLALYSGASFGPPPPDANMIGYSALALYLFIPLLAWIDKHRTKKSITGG